MEIFKEKSKKNKKLSIFSKDSFNIFLLLLVGLAFIVGVILSNRIKATHAYTKTVDNIRLFFSNNNQLIQKINYNEQDQIDIDIKFKEWQKLSYLREKALQNTHIPVECQEKVPAKIRYKSKTYKVDVSLTGFLLEHIQDPLQWSLGVKVKGDSTILGMKKFALLIPEARGYLTDWITHKMLKKRQIIGLRSDYIDVNINGSYHGIYYVEERFDKRLIEANQLREGIVFKANISFPNKGGYSQIESTLKRTFDYKTELIPYGTSRIESNPELKELFINLKKKWEAFESNSLPVEQVFDMRKFAALFAITNLVNENHGLSIHNLRFYYNPITSLIEPVAREWMGINKNKSFRNLFIEGENSLEMIDNHYLRTRFHDKLYANIDFKKMYIEEANIVSSHIFLEEVILENQNKINFLTEKINQYNPKYKLPLEILQKNQETIRKKLYPKTPSLKIYFEKKTSDSLVLLIENLSKLPNEINGIKMNEEVISDEKIFINAKQDVKDKFQRISLKINDSINIEDFHSDFLTVFYNTYGLENRTINFLEKDVFSKTIVYPKVMKTNDYSQYSLPNRPSNFEQFEFLELNESNKVITFKNKNCDIKNDLIFPSGYRVFIPAGTNINLRNKSRIISHSPLIFFGTEEDLITVASSDSTGQGLVVYSSKEKSELNYVEFKFLSNISAPGWNLRGAITFYESPVYINHCIFNSNIKGDDYLNVVRTNFTLLNTTFQNTFADAFDTDFCRGIIKNVNFTKIGNDAIDVSGTEATIIDVKITATGDKGVSGGEDSNLSCKNISISGTEIAVASKDKTNIIIDGIEITNSKLGYCAFQKKSEFGPGTIIATNSTLNQVQTKYLIETGSDLTLNNVIISSKSNQVKQYLYGAEYGKDSK